MRKFALFLGLLLLAAPLTVVHASQLTCQEMNAPRIALLGYKISGGLKVYVLYNPNRDEVLDVWAEDLIGNEYTVTSYSGDISYSGGIMQATNFHVVSTIGSTILNGALTLITP